MLNKVWEKREKGIKTDKNNSPSIFFPHSLSFYIRFSNNLQFNGPPKYLQFNKPPSPVEFLV